MLYRNTKYICVLMIIAVLIGGYWLFSDAFDIGKPEIKMHPDVHMIGRQGVIEVTFSDRGSGLRDVWITISQGDKTHMLYTFHYPQKGTQNQTIPVTIDPLKTRLQDGPATLNIQAVDYSLLKNQTLLSKTLMIDMLPPQIHLLSSQNIINPGGTCVALYQTSKSVVLSGIQVDDRYYLSYLTVISGKPYHIVYFSLPIEARQGTTRIKTVVRDQAGNESVMDLPHLIKKKNFRADRMNLSDQFLQNKMPEFQSADVNLRAKTPLDTFIHVNSVIRQENLKTIQALTRKSEGRQLWTGTFLRMKNASPMALYGDQRTYFYNGKIVGESLHEGVDLASVQQAPIEAANHGIVVFAGALGIYGSTVIIDHGFGLFTLYAHLSAMDVKAGQAVKKEDVIGRSGMTGLAGGDHLHFSVIAGGQFVNPLEWWDPHWIADNVSRKLTDAN